MVFFPFFPTVSASLLEFPAGLASRFASGPWWCSRRMLWGHSGLHSSPREKGALKQWNSKRFIEVPWKSLKSVVNSSLDIIPTLFWPKSPWQTSQFSGNLEDWRRTPQPQWLPFIQPFVFSIVWKKRSNGCNLDGKRVLGEILQFVYWNHTLNNLLSLPVPADSLVGSNLKSYLTQGFKTTGLEETLACSLIQPVPELAKPKAKFDPECRFQVRSQKVPKAKSLSGG